ncbi:MAG TPA: LacI family DNA-binding transcriptional regulator [Panacibacter sp.]|nr:LacI family DNA-binding transcriptional regulator [Panacibacter sp.]
MKHNTTLKKISHILDISISTVSRALKDHPDISDKTKKKVIELADTLEYEPNTYAINLRTNNSRVFTLMVPSVTYYFYDSFISSIEEECRKSGYSLMILQSGDNTETELTNLKLSRQNRVSGLFVCITPNTTDIAPFLKLNELDIPVIFFDKVPDYEACNKVCVADTQAAKIAAEFILKKQKKKILGLFGNINMSITKKRLDAFTGVFQQPNVKAKLITGFALSADDARNKTIESLTSKSKPDTIFCMSDEILTGAMKAIQELHLAIPKDISVISISNGIIPKLYYPEITYVETSGYKLGKLAFTRMMGCLSGSTFMQELIVESLLIEGGSL